MTDFLPLLVALALKDKPKEVGPAPGHSHYGPAFDEGPRQRATLMPGTGHVRCPVTSDSDEAAKFVRQGIGQMHGFWYFEAERSFRQAAAIDPDCALAYWGLAALHRNDKQRGPAFLKKAVEKRNLASPREQAWIEGIAAYIGGEKKTDKERAQAWLKKWEDILADYPDDLEAKAFLAWLMWDAKDKLPIVSREAVDALIQQVLAVEPLHPAHHFAIHLWDDSKPKRAVASANLCGTGSPGVAHMWHMPAHTYDKLGRTADAAWQLEASARTDHAYMQRDRVLPYSIHNYSHNNEWLTRNLIHLGRAEAALDIARNLCEIPRHPKHNVLGNYGHPAEQGRKRLPEVLVRFERWDDAIALCLAQVYDVGPNSAEQARWLRLLGRAYAEKGDEAHARGVWTAAHLRAAWSSFTQYGPAAKAEADALAKKQKPEEVRKAVKAALSEAATRQRHFREAAAEVSAWQHFQANPTNATLEKVKSAGEVYAPQLARLQLKAGLTEDAVKTARSASDGDNKVLPLGALVEVLAATGKRDEAKKLFEKLRTVAGTADPDLMLFGRLAPLALEFGYPIDWRTPTAPDFGPRPPLDSLGPRAWSPQPAPSFSLPDADGRTVQLADYRGKPVVVLFHLGSGCPHCVEQLDKFAPLASKFAAQGITLVSVSTEPPSGLRRDGLTNLFDPTLSAFRAYRAHDDFEKLALHGTFLIDARGLVRWQDISFEPFGDPEFLLREAKRLLALPATPERAALTRGDGGR